MELPGVFLLGVTWIGQEHRFLGLDWSYLTLLGLIGNGIFGTRFLIQWIASEREGKCVVPVAFWYWSVLGSVVLSLYFIFRREPVGILATLPNSFIYLRNLQLIKKQQAAEAKAPRVPVPPVAS
jgi:lipid-A-disaccharide synthase-like uncharacterized protein